MVWVSGAVDRSVMRELAFVNKRSDALMSQLRRRRADDVEAEQTCRARRGREQDFVEISRRMYEEIRSSRDPRDHVEDG